MFQKAHRRYIANKCEGWCATETSTWSAKCTWEKCKKCSDCKSNTESPKEPAEPTSESTLGPSWCHQMSKCFGEVWPSSSFLPWSAELTKHCIKGNLESSRFNPAG